MRPRRRALLAAFLASVLLAVASGALGLVVLSGAGATVTYTEDGGTVIPFPGLLITGSASTLASATVSVTANFEGSQDRLGFTNNGTTMGNIGGVFNSGTGVLTLTSAGATATTNQWHDALRSTVYWNTSQNPSTSNRTLVARVDDGSGPSDPVSATVAITAVNDAPVVTTTTGTAAAVRDTAIPVDSAITVSDSDSATLASATVAITIGYREAQDRLGLDANPSTMGNVTSTWNAGTGVLTLTSAGGTATVAQWQTALRAVTYRCLVGHPDTALRTVSFTANDGLLSSNTATRTVSVAAINRAPVLTSTSFTSPATNPIPVTGSHLFTSYQDDVDSPMVSVTIVALPDAGTLTYNGSPVTVGQVIPAANWLGNATPNVIYTPQAGDVTWRSITYTASDGALSSGQATMTFRLYPTVVPVLVLSGAPLQAPFTVAAAIDAAAAITWIGNRGIAGVTVQVTGGLQPDDVLTLATGIDPIGNINVTGTSAGYINLQSADISATPAEWQNALRRLTIRAVSGPGLRRTVTFTLYWPAGQVVATRSVDVAPGTDGPAAPDGSGTQAPGDTPTVPMPAASATAAACTRRALRLRAGQSLTAAGIARARCLPTGTRIIAVARTSRRICTASRTHMRAVRAGTCRLTLRTPSGQQRAATVTVRQRSP